MTTAFSKKPTAKSEPVQLQQSQSNLHSADARRYDAQFHAIGISAVAAGATAMRMQAKKPKMTDIPAILRQPSED